MDDPQKELEKELELELVPFLRRGTGGGTSSYFGEGTGTGTSSFLKGTFNCLFLCTPYDGVRLKNAT